MKPSDFYLGVSELFSILIPGFVATIVVSIYFDVLKYPTAGPNEWILIMVSSYICGHILFAVGSLWDGLYDKVKPTGNNELLDNIAQIREYDSDKDCDSINKYKWCRSVLSKVHPEGYAEVLRKEADSKLFRSLIIPLLITFVFLILKNEYYYSFISVGMAFISFSRYRGQRFKACKISYTHVIVLNQLGLLK
jgi:hypothetical protein